MVVTNRMGFRIGCILHCQRDTSGSQFWLFSQHLLFVGQCRIEWNGQSILYDSKDNSTGKSHGTLAEVEHKSFGAIHPLLSQDLELISLMVGKNISLNKRAAHANKYYQTKLH